jgi:Flp pilus assembly protein TadD
MNRTTRFWFFMAVFQVIFGVTVFGLTRHFYSQPPNSPAPAQATSHVAGAGLPDTAPGSDLQQLMNLFPAQPTQPATQDPQATLMNADNHFALGQFEQAAQGYSQLIGMGTVDADIYNNLGITLHYLGRSSEALTVLDQGIAIDPNYQRIWLTKGFVNSQTGNIEQARSALGRAVALDPRTEVGLSAQQMLNQLDG